MRITNIEAIPVRIPQQNADLAEILRVDGEQVHARPGSVALAGGLAQRDADAGHFERAEQGQQSILELGGQGCLSRQIS